MSPPLRTQRCILLLVDGLRPDLAESMLDAGELPALAAMLGTGSMARAITAFPSTTSVAYLPFLTGCTPGRCNVPSIRWLDRTAYNGDWWRDRNAMRSYCGYQAPMLDDDIAPGVQTIFELVPESVGIFTPVAKGLTLERDPSRGERKFWGGVSHYTLWHQPSDDAVSRHLFKALDGPSRFIFAQFPAVDGYTHQTTPDSPKVRQALRMVDRTVGRLRARLQEKGILDETLILMVSDHGATVVKQHLDLPEWFRSQGVRTLSHPIIWEKSPKAAVMVAGNASATVYADPGKSRPERWPMSRLRKGESFGVGHDVIAKLIEEPGVAFVAAENDNGGITVLSRDGEAAISGSVTDFSYLPTSGDPLELGGECRGTARQWLEQSWNAPYPDAAFHLLDQFRSSRTGDLIVVAREGTDFRKRFEIPEHKAGHGSLFKGHMQVPAWSSQPGLATPVRTVDLFPAMLDWLGVPIPPGIDGNPVWLPDQRRRFHSADPATFSTSPQPVRSSVR